MSARCRECHAAIHVPGDVHVLAMRCTYCGLEQPVPDVEARRQFLLEQQREARLDAERRERAEQAEREAAERHEERKQARRGRWVAWLGTLVGVLVGPTIIAITVFDLPARLGFGASGKDRLELIERQLATGGCTPVIAPDSQYANSNVTKLFPIAAGQCARVFAAGGDGHSTLGLKLFGPDGAQLVDGADNTSDPQLQYCATAAATLRFEIKIGVASKGRLSYMVLACPPPTPDAPAAEPEPPAKPAKKKR
ncbi:MAG TPA: hypothetical protein VFQ53_40465 [Kofleriaceae bacterium]|nr:hypothetical protein [Kofleriaceae bacterium]